MNATAKTEIKPAHEKIAQRAYQLWEKDGRKPGLDAKYWLQAENELRSAGITADPAKTPPRASAAIILGNNRTTGKRSRLHADR
jgi:hypothetical protein